MRKQLCLDWTATARGAAVFALLHIVGLGFAAGLRVAAVFAAVFAFLHIAGLGFAAALRGSRWLACWLCS